MEEAGASLGASAPTIMRRIVLPNLAPAVLTGSALGFARCIGEFGSVVLIAGQHPVPDRAGIGLHLRPGRG